MALAEAAHAAVVLANAVAALRQIERKLGCPPLSPDDAGTALVEAGGAYAVDLHGLMNREARRLLAAAMNEDKTPSEGRGEEMDR